ncbi:MAG TPA: protein-glutamate O-methyltransferase CheR [Actinomycetota bacterium]|nr:protein-glutamate O-methyltransferase CheR [Actinomycetota bacterium]
MRTDHLEELELDLLLEGIYRRYGYDFRQYARGSLRRRVERRVQDERVGSVTALTDKILRDPAAMDRLVYELSINVTAMFRDPTFYQAFRDKVVPLLRTYPFIRIWNAGCSTGEETFSLAILLHENGLYERTRIYATDMNDRVLARAAEGTFPLDKMRGYTENYIRAGGQKAFSEYYSTTLGGAKFHSSLTDNVVFAQHNLASDRAFNEFNVVMCRNVMIYFDRELQEHVHGLFHDSLVNFGILALGRKETLQLSAYEDRYEEIDRMERIYRKVS